VQAQLALQLLELAAALVVRAASQVVQAVAVRFILKLTAVVVEAAATKQRLQVAQAQAVVVLVQPVLRRLTLQTLPVQVVAQQVAQRIQARLAARVLAAALLWAAQVVLRVMPAAQPNTAVLAAAALQVETQLLEMVEVQFMVQVAVAQGAALTVVTLLVTQG
jgi:hypothetical protein